MIEEKPLKDFRVSLPSGSDSLVCAGSYRTSGGRLEFYDEYDRYMLGYEPDEWTDVEED